MLLCTAPANPLSGYGYIQLLGSFLLGSNLCLFIEGLGSTSKRSGSSEILLGPGKLGSGHQLHGLGDLLDVSHRLQPHTNNLQVGHLVDFVESGEKIKIK